ncbi:MAG TPA: lipoyl(octanoyl) transferase LipB [Oscillatoriaceae cyanobacterium]
MPSLSPLAIRWLGRQPYETTWALQKALIGPIADGEAPETLLLVEHDPVITLGRKAGAAQNVLSPDWSVIETERGGDATYHGPGQLVAYPLLALREGERDLHRYLRNLESLIIATLADYGLPGERRDGLTGVWVHDRKVASLGVAVRRWVTYHGLALNVTADLGHFARLNPCGLSSDVMGSMATWLEKPPALREVADRLVAHLPETLGRSAEPVALEMPT